LQPQELRQFGADLARWLAATDRTSGPYGGVSPATVVFTESGVEVTASPTLAESAGYVAPEIASGAPAHAASDVFAFGAVLVYAATGAGPFGSGTPVELLIRALTSEPDLEAVPPGLRQVAADCLSRDPLRRPSAADLAMRFTIALSPTEPVAGSTPSTPLPPESAGSTPQSAPLLIDSTSTPTQFVSLSKQPALRAAKSAASSPASDAPSTPTVTPAPESSVPPRLRTPPLRRRVRVAIGALFSVAVLAAAATYAVGHDRPTDAGATEFATTSPAVIATPAVTALAMSPDGRRIYLGGRTPPTVTVIDTASNTVTALIGVPQKPNGLAVSPDGAYVYVVSNNALSVITTASNTLTGVTIADYDSTLEAVAVSHDGTHLYIADGLRATVTIRDARTRAATATTPLGTGYDIVDAIALTGDGRRFFAVMPRQIAMLDAATATVTTRTAFEGPDSTIVVGADGRFVYAMGKPSSKVHVFDGSTGASVAVVQLNGIGNGLAISPSGRYMFVAIQPTSRDGSSGDIAVIDTTTRTVVGNLQPGLKVEHLAVTPDGHRLYAAPSEHDGGGVAVMDVRRYL